MVYLLFGMGLVADLSLIHIWFLCRAGKNVNFQMGAFKSYRTSFGRSQSNNQPTFTGDELRKIREKQEVLWKQVFPRNRKQPTSILMKQTAWSKSVPVSYTHLKGNKPRPVWPDTKANRNNRVGIIWKSRKTQCLQGFSDFAHFFW